MQIDLGAIFQAISLLVFFRWSYLCRTPLRFFVWPPSNRIRQRAIL